MDGIEFLKQQLPSVVVPSTKVPTWEGGQHPAAKRVDAKSLAWADSQGIFLDERHRARAERLHVGSFAARIYCHADEAFIQCMADFLLWFYTVDDLYVDRVDTINNESVRNLTAVVDVIDLLEVAPDAPYGAHQCLNLCLRLKALVPAECYERWAEGIRLWAMSGSLMILGESRVGSCKLPQYEVIRRYLSGVIPFVACSDFAESGKAITSAEFYHPKVQQLIRLTCNMTAWSNDNDSLAAELYQPGQQMNMTILRAAENGLDLREAVEYTAGRAKLEIERFEQVETEVLEGASDALQGLCRGLRRWMRGYRDWVEFDTCRYDAKYAVEDSDDRDLVHIAQGVVMQAVSV